MSEKIYACVLHLLAPRFYRIYGEEATRLVRDRCLNERGIIGKIRLWLDLLTDLVAAVIRDGRFTSQELLSQQAATQPIKPVPSFAVVTGGLPHAAALLIGGAFSLGLLATFSAFVGQSGHDQASFPPLPGLLPFSTPTPTISKQSDIQEQTRLVRAPRFETPRFSAHSAGRSVTFTTDAGFDAKEKKRVLAGAIAHLRESYVYPDIARKMIEALLTHERNGDYENEINGSEFAALLTKHLQEVSHDLHLRVVYRADEVPTLGPPEADPHFRRMLERDNCAFRQVEVLPHNIGYVKFDAFAPASLCRETAGAAMQFLAHVDGLIFDLRENHGGDPHMTTFMASYLFDHRIHLNDIYNQRDKSTEEFWTAPEVPGPRFGKTPVYVLTSAETFSGAEEFTYDLKNLKRAVIIGETTGGGAHLVMMHRLDAHFIIGVPFARPINPISKTNWEGTGVVPDVQINAADALGVAKRLIANKLGVK